MDSNFHKSTEIFTRKLETTLFALTVSSLSIIIVFSEPLLIKSTSVILLICYTFLKISKAYPSYRFEDSKLVEYRFPVKKEIHSNGEFYIKEKYIFKKILFDLNELKEVDSSFIKGKRILKFTLKNGSKISIVGVKDEFLTDLSSSWIDSVDSNGISS